MPNPKKKARDNQDIVDAAYEGYVVDRIPTTMMTPSEASATNRYWQREAMMHPVGDEFWDPTELMPAVSIAGVSPAEERRAIVRGEGQRAADTLSARQNYVGSKYVAPAFAATMAAPWLVGAGAYAAANPMTLAGGAKNGYSWLEKNIPKALPYLQPSGWIDPLVGGASGLGAAGYYQGARTLAGGVADALFDSYWAGNAARNMGRSGNVAGEVMNAMDLLPLVGIGAAVAGRGARALDARAARRMDDAIKGFARQKGLSPAVHNATGEKVFLDSAGNPFQYINGEFVPFDGENSEWIPNSLQDYVNSQIAETLTRMNAPEESRATRRSMRDEAIGQLNEERVELPFYSPDDDLSMVTERQLQNMAADWRNDPSMARAATNELSRRGIISRAALERPRTETHSIEVNPDVQALLDELDLTETGRDLASPDLPPPPPEVNNVADTSRNVAESAGPRVIGNIVTDPGGLLSRDIGSLRSEELDLIISSGHATDEHRIERGRRANREVNHLLDSYAIEDMSNSQLARLANELQNPELNAGLSTAEDNYIQDPEAFLSIVEDELRSRGNSLMSRGHSVVAPATPEPLLSQATSTSADAPYGRLSSGRVIDSSIQISDLTQDEFDELGDLGGVPFYRRMASMSDRGDITEDARARIMRRYFYRERTGRSLDDDISDVMSMSPSEAYAKLRDMAMDGRTSLDDLFNGEEVPDKIKEIVRNGAFEYMKSSYSDSGLADALISAMRERVKVPNASLYGPAYRADLLDDYNGPLRKEEVKAVIAAMKERFPEAGVDFSKIDSIEGLSEIQGFLRDKGLVDWGTSLPLDQEHLSFFADKDPALLEIASRRGYEINAEMPRHAAVTENDTSTQSEPMKLIGAAKNYGTGPGELTIEYLMDPLDPGKPLMKKRNFHGDHRFTLNPDGSISLGFEKSFKRHNPDFDLSKNPFTPEEVSALKDVYKKKRIDTPEEQALVDRYSDLVKRVDRSAMAEYDRAVGLLERQSGKPHFRSEEIPFNFFDGMDSFKHTTSNGGIRYIGSYMSPYTFVYKHRLGGTLLRQFDGGGDIPVFSPLADFRSSHPMTLPKPTLRISGDGFHGFGGGEFGGAGASGYWDISLDPLVASQYVRNTPIMGERSFSDAYAEARKAGLPDFVFNGQRYTTDYDPNAKLGKHKYEPTAVLNIREVLDENKKPIADSTRIEPWIGQIPGTQERRYDGGGDIEYDIEPAIVKPAPVRVNLYTDPITKNTPITHSWMEAGPRDGSDFGFRVSKGSFDPTYNLLLANCSDATGEILETLSGQDFTSGITTPYGVRRKAREVFGSYPMYGETGDKTTVQSFYVPWYDYRKAKDVANSRQLETNLALAKKNGAGPEVLQQIRDTWAESHPVLPYTLDADGNVVSYKKGGGIHIDPSKKGTFRAQATKMGMSVKQAAAHILAHKENYSPAMVKKANFARNFAGDGGLLERYGPDRIKEALEKIKRG